MSAPWYRSKTEPSTLDMLTSLRRQIIAARFLPSTPDQLVLKWSVRHWH
ncbi:MAG: hypothetical protein ACRDT0_01745 [Pseudonocardiaceae bacterium]